MNKSTDMVYIFRALGGNIRYTEYPYNGHDMRGKPYKEPELMEWLFAQRRKQLWYPGKELSITGIQADPGVNPK